MFHRYKRLADENGIHEVDSIGRPDRLNEQALIELQKDVDIVTGS
jgi:hypothetical protein